MFGCGADGLEVCGDGFEAMEEGVDVDALDVGTFAALVFGYVFEACNGVGLMGGVCGGLVVDGGLLAGVLEIFDASVC